jgi:selenide,water dikinase
LGPGDLQNVFSMVDLTMSHPDLLVGTNTLDDAGVFRLTPELALVQTVDYFTPIVDDPYAYGQIAAANALSDIYAMGGVPKTVLNIVGYPIAKLPPEILAKILQGGADKVREAGAVVVGGHSIDDVDPKFGMAVTGLVHPDRIWTNSGAEPGDALILTKPIGVGAVTTAIKRGIASAEDAAEATAVMVTLNRVAAEVAAHFTVHACTDVTGFGLAGHLLEMVRGSGVCAILFADQVPLLANACRYAEDGVVPGGSKRNALHVQPHVVYDSALNTGLAALMTDSVTSGGLLLAVPEQEAPALVKALHAAGVGAAARIGRIEPLSKGPSIWIRAMDSCPEKGQPHTR